MTRCEACAEDATHCCGGLDVPMLHFCERHGLQHQREANCGGTLVKMEQLQDAQDAAESGEQP